MGLAMHPDQYEWEQEEAEARLFEEQLQALAEEPVFAYLARHGDAVQERVERCRDEAAALSSAGFDGAALVRAAAGIELTVRFFLARPLLQGAFLSEAWASALTDRIFGRRGADERDLLPSVLANWHVDVTKVLLASGEQAWEVVRTRVWPLRNDYVHAGAELSKADGTVAIECLDAMWSGLVEPVANRLGFTLGTTGKWSVVEVWEEGVMIRHSEAEAGSPFTLRG
jgi:hypothetical protein